MKEDIVIIINDGIVEDVLSLDPRLNCMVIYLDDGSFDPDDEEWRVALAEEVRANREYTVIR